MASSIRYRPLRRAALQRSCIRAMLRPGVGQVRRLTWACSIFLPAFKAAARSPRADLRRRKQGHVADRQGDAGAARGLRRSSTPAGRLAADAAEPAHRAAAPPAQAEDAGGGGLGGSLGDVLGGMLGGGRSAGTAGGGGSAICCAAPWAEFSAARPPERCSAAASAGWSSGSRRAARATSPAPGSAPAPTSRSRRAISPARSAPIRSTAWPVRPACEREEMLSGLSRELPASSTSSRRTAGCRATRKPQDWCDGTGDRHTRDFEPRQFGGGAAPVNGARMHPTGTTAWRRGLSGAQRTTAPGRRP